MESIQRIIERKTPPIKKKSTGRAINLRYEQATQVARYTGLNILYVMKLQKQYGMAKVEHLKTFLADIPNLDPKRAPGLAVWYLRKK